MKHVKISDVKNFLKLEGAVGEAYEDFTVDLKKKIRRGEGCTQEKRREGSTKGKLTRSTVKVWVKMKEGKNLLQVEMAYSLPKSSLLTHHHPHPHGRVSILPMR